MGFILLNAASRQVGVTWDETGFYRGVSTVAGTLKAGLASLDFHPLKAAGFVRQYPIGRVLNRGLEPLSHLRPLEAYRAVFHSYDFKNFRGQLSNFLHFRLSAAWGAFFHYPSWTSISPSTPVLPRVISAMFKMPFGFLFPGITSYRLGSMAAFLWMLWMVYLLAQRLSGDWKTAAWAVAFCAAMPRLVAYGMIASGEAPVMAAWLTAVYVFLYCLEKNRPGWLFGLCFGLALLCKYQAFFILPILLSWGLLTRSRRALGLVLWGAVLGPLVFLLAQPQYYPPHMLEQLAEIPNVTFRHYGVAHYFMGHKMNGQGPWFYPWVMTAVTVPSLVLVLGLLGCVKVFRPLPFRPLPLLVLLNFTLPLAAMSLPGAPQYDGERLFIESCPFLAILAAWFFRSIPWVRLRKLTAAFLAAGMVHAALTVPPFFLAYYNQLAGGPSGAKALGFESTYWLDAVTPGVLEAINREVPADGSVWLWGCTDENMIGYQNFGLLRKDIRWNMDLNPSDSFILAYARQGRLASVEEFEILKPVYEIDFQGVPLVKLAPIEGR